MIPKLDLLPEWYREGKRVRNTWILVALAWIIVIGGMIYYSRQLQARIAALDEEIAAIKPDADLKDKLESEATNIRSSITTVTNKVTFIKAIHEYNRKFPDLFENTNKYTYYRVGYRSLQPAITVLNMSAYCRSVSDIGRFLLNMQRAKGLFTAISITGGIPGGSAGGEAVQGAEGMVASATPVFNPYTAYTSSPASSPAASPYGPPSPMSNPYASYAGFSSGSSESGSTIPGLLEFQAVAQLAEKWIFTVPTYAGATTTTTEGAGYGVPYGPYGPYGPPGGPGMNGVGPNAAAPANATPANASASTESTGGEEIGGGLGRRRLGGGE